MGTPIISDLQELIANVINLIGWVWTNSPTLLKTFVFFSAFVVFVAVLGYFFDSSLSFGGIMLKPPISHRLFLNDTCQSAQSLQYSELSWTSNCNEIAQCLNQYGGYATVIQFAGLGLWEVPRCVCQCTNVSVLSPIFPEAPLYAKLTDIASLTCESALGVNACFSYMNYTTNATLTLRDYCVNQSVPSSTDILNIKKTLEECKTAGFDFLDWKALLTLETIVLLGQFVLTMRASRNK